MGFRSFFVKPVATYTAFRSKKWSSQASIDQNKILSYLLKKGAKTRFGKAHNFSAISNYEDFKKNISVRDYEGLSPYFNDVLQGHSDVLWPGKPLYLSKTSGTTSGVKYIPITPDSISNHIDGAWHAVLNYIHQTGKASFFDNKWIFLSGSPALEKKGDLKIGRLSGIVNHHVPSYLQTHQMPSYETNCIADWEHKLDSIIAETLEQKMGLISGIPPWVQMYFDRIRIKTGKKIKDVFPDFSLLMHGGVNFSPYRDRLFESIGKTLDTVEIYPASEGFIAYQDIQHEEGMLLLTHSGIFFEFIPVEEYFHKHPTRIGIEDVELDKNYALIINSNAGLWGYSIGDTIKFISINPYRLVVSGRLTHFISAFGEHVIGEEVEKAMKMTMEHFPEVKIVEFTVAPQVNPEEGLPHHEWLVEFSTPPADVSAFALKLDAHLCRLNIYYKDLISGGVLRTLNVTPMKKHTFIEYMKSQGKLGGQNKVPRLSNKRSIADRLIDLAGTTSTG